MNMKNIGLKIFVAVVVAAVAIVAGIGFYVSGTPRHARAEKSDRMRENNLSQISNAVNVYWSSNNKRMPTTLEELQNQKNGQVGYAYVESLKDPVTHQDYEYLPTSTSTYKLCAAFETKATSHFSPSSIFTDHEAGRQCFEMNVQGWPVKPDGSPIPREM